MRLLNECPTYLIKTDFFKGKFLAYAKTELTPREADLFGCAQVMVEQQCNKDGISRSNIPIFCVIFSDDGSFTLVPDSTDVNAYGHRLQIIVYTMNKLRESPNEELWIATFVEELAHLIWNIHDELLVKRKVVEIIRNMLPAFSLDNLERLGIQIN